MFLVTGGAGFIGSNVVASLNEAGASDIVVNDLLGHDDAKWRNLAKHHLKATFPYYGNLRRESLQSSRPALNGNCL